MDPTRFDRLTKLFATRWTRRQALTTGGVGLAATSLVSTGLVAATAQVATPVATPAFPADPHPSADTARTHPEYLFVQPFDAGTWAPKPGAEGVYTLTLTGAAAHTTYFSDRPERDTGLAPTQPFLDGLGFTPKNPPNAALVVQTQSGTEDILVVELFNPVYDAKAAILTYEAKVLRDYSGRGLADLAQKQADYKLDASFGEGSLFIDNCADSIESCFVYTYGADGTSCTYNYVGNITSGNCWNNNSWRCEPCASYDAQCYSTFPTVCNGSANGMCYDDIDLCGDPACCAAKGGCACPV